MFNSPKLNIATPSSVIARIMIEHMGGFKEGLTKQELGAIIQGQSSHWPEYTFNTQLQQYEHDRCQRKQDTGDDMPALLPSAREFCVEHEHLYQCEKCQRKHQLQAASTFTCRVHPRHLPTHYMLEHEASTFKSSDRGHWLGKHPIPTPKTKGKKCQSKSAQDEIDKRFLELEELLRKLGYKYIGWEGKHPLLIHDREGHIITIFISMPEDAKWPQGGPSGRGDRESTSGGFVHRGVFWQ
ncbi:hypothetical protein B0H10DRAFT_1951804 [Mycena sp. CBHHK59/15]|nr:hypothetical protein B0H10DRAFT_1951804 [Mycena sp. CBHHK59/15]